MLLSPPLPASLSASFAVASDSSLVFIPFSIADSGRSNQLRPNLSHSLLSRHLLGFFLTVPTTGPCHSTVDFHLHLEQLLMIRAGFFHHNIARQGVVLFLAPFLKTGFVIVSSRLGLLRFDVAQLVL